MSVTRSAWPARLLLGLACLCLAASAAFLHGQAREDALVDAFLAHHGLLGRPATKQTAIAASQVLREEFEVDPGRWKSLALGRRPFLREDTAWLLATKEGLCGEGTRVLVNLLTRLGFDATRVTLYDKHLRPTHTLASVQLDRREVLIDSLNTSRETNRFLNDNEISTRDFRLLHYTDDIPARLEAGRRLRALADPSDPERAAFFDKYRLFSYEALPLTKLLTRVGFDLRVFNLERPAPWLSALAEKPRLVQAGGWLLAALTLGAAGWLARVARRRQRAGTPLAALATSPAR